jgi:CubicO group peptidase (beta-lactamase class C family)
VTKWWMCAALAAGIAAGADGLAKPDPVGAGMDPQRLARIRTRMQKFVDDGAAAGIVTLVARHGKLASLSAVGYRDLEKRTPMRTDSIFRIMSMTKPVSAVAVMILMEEGRLALFDPVSRHLPEFQTQSVKGKRPPALFDLLTHTSGLAEPREATKPATLAERVAGVAKAPLEFEPGAQWRYRTSNLDVLGRVVEVAAGMPFEKFVALRIFGPLGMADSSFHPVEAKAGRIASLYTDEGGRLTLTTVSRDTLYPSPGAGMLSTAADMARFYQMLLNRGTFDGKRILSAATVELMTTLHTGNLEAGFAPGMGFGLGIGLVREPKGMYRLCSVGSFGHGGAYRTYSWADPAKDMVRVIMLQRTNVGGDQADEINAFLAMAAAAIEK